MKLRFQLHRLYEWLRRQPWAQWCARWFYAQHNARVLVEMEGRFSRVLDYASGGMISKPYYSDEVNEQMIREHLWSQYKEGYNDAEEDHDLTPTTFNDRCSKIAKEAAA